MKDSRKMGSWSRSGARHDRSKLKTACRTSEGDRVNIVKPATNLGNSRVRIIGMEGADKKKHRAQDLRAWTTTKPQFGEY